MKHLFVKIWITFHNRSVLYIRIFDCGHKGHIVKLEYSEEGTRIKYVYLMLLKGYQSQLGALVKIHCFCLWSPSHPPEYWVRWKAGAGEVRG